MRRFYVFLVYSVTYSLKPDILRLLTLQIVMDVDNFLSFNSQSMHFAHGHIFCRGLS